MVVWYLRSRVTVLAALGALALGQRCVTERPPEHELAAVAQFFGRALAAQGSTSLPLHVDADSIQWELSRGSLIDAILGRRAVLRATLADDRPYDVYRLRARVSPDGRVLAVNQWRNLTETPLGDERDLASKDGVVMFTTYAYQKLSGLSVLQLEGAPDSERGAKSSSALSPGDWCNRLLGALRAYYQTGTFNGIGRLHLTFAEPRAMEARLSSQAITVTEKGSGRTETVKLAETTQTAAGDLVRSAARQPYASTGWVHTLRYLITDLTRVDPGLWLDHWSNSGQRYWKRADTAPQAETGLRPADRLTPSPESHMASMPWPPPPLDLRLTNAPTGEGLWKPAGPNSAQELESDQHNFLNTPFAKTWLRPDPESHTRLHLVAMDMRRLSIGVQAGYERPKALTGPPGAGRVSRSGVNARVVAVFNGGTDRDESHGIMTEGRLLIPPTGGAATLAVRADGWVGIGTWPLTLDSTQRSDTDGILSFRQQSTPLLNGGVVINVVGQDRHRSDQMITERSAICRTQAGQLYYAWSRRLTQRTLAQGLKDAGCDYAINLGAHPGEGGMVFMSPRQPGAARDEAELVDPEMNMRPPGELSGVADDFFYVTESDANQGMTSRARELGWLSSAGAQPEPAQWPAIWESALSLGALQVRVLRVEPGRLRYAATASTLEPLLQDRPAPRRRLPQSLRAQPLLAVSLGHTTPRLGYGLAYGKRITVPIRKEYGSLVIAADGGLDVLPSGVAYVPRAQEVVVQLPELVSDGVVVRRATERGRRSTRGAVCVQGARLWLATGEHDSSDAVAVTLRDLGCETVLELDRGSRHPVDVRRTELEELAAATSDRTWLWGVGMPMQPRTYAL